MTAARSVPPSTRTETTRHACDAGLAPWSLQVLEVIDGRIGGIAFSLDTERWFPLVDLPPRLDA